MENAAVRRCHQAWVEFLCTAHGKRNVRDFIACTAYGLLLGAIEPKDATKLLYAAQVAAIAGQRKKESRREAF